MIAAVREEGATVVVVWHSDRLERRGARELLNLLERNKDAGARVESVKEPELRAASMGGQIMTFLGGLMAHAESAHESDRIKAKHAHLRAIGSWASGKAPFGYDIVSTDDGRKTIKPNADAATVSRRVAADPGDEKTPGLPLRSREGPGTTSHALLGAGSSLRER